MHGSDVLKRLVVTILSSQSYRGQRCGADQARRCFAAVPETLYEVLGVGRKANKPIIKAAFRKVTMTPCSCTVPQRLDAEPEYMHVVATRSVLF